MYTRKSSYSRASGEMNNYSPCPDRRRQVSRTGQGSVIAQKPVHSLTVLH
jgi:hypothetical protein